MIVFAIYLAHRISHCAQHSSKGFSCAKFEIQIIPISSMSSPANCENALAVVDDFHFLPWFHYVAMHIMFHCALNSTAAVAKALIIMIPFLICSLWPLLPLLQLMENSSALFSHHLHGNYSQSESSQHKGCQWFCTSMKLQAMRTVAETQMLLFNACIYVHIKCVCPNVKCTSSAWIFRQFLRGELRASFSRGEKGVKAFFPVATCLVSNGGLKMHLGCWKWPNNSLKALMDKTELFAAGKKKLNKLVVVYKSINQCCCFCYRFPATCSTICIIHAILGLMECSVG